MCIRDSTFSVNNTPTNGAAAIWAVITTLIAVGWTQIGSGDASTYANGSAGPVSGSGSGANGLNNNNAWVRLRAPAVNGGAIVNQTREILFQRGAAETAWRLKYSASAGFVGGSPSSTVSPTATDQVVMAGAGTDTSPTFNTFFGTAGTYRWHICCGGAAEFYSFYAFVVTSGTLNTASGFYMDVLATGSYPPEDVDPCVFYCSNNFANNTDYSWFGGNYNYGYATVANPAGPRAWLGPTSQAEASTTTNNVAVWIMSINQYIGAGYSVGKNPFNNKPIGIPCWYVRWGNTIFGVSLALPYGIKGCSTLIQHTTEQCWQLDTVSTASTKDKIYLCTAVGIWLPWGGVTPII